MIVTPKNTRVVAEQVGDNTRYQSPNSAAEVTEELGDDVRARTSAQLGTDLRANLELVCLTRARATIYT